MSETPGGEVPGDGAVVAPGRAAGRFAVRVSIGWVALVLATLGFVLLLAAVEVAWDPLLALDRGISDTLIRWTARTPLVASVARFITHLGGGAALAVVGVSVVGWFLVRRRLHVALYVAATLIGARLLEWSAKQLIGRARPMLPDAVAVAPGFSFPSGHALNSLVGYGLVLGVILPALSRPRRGVATLLVGALVGLIGLTRILLGVHFLSDVVAGWLLGAVWLTVTTAAFRVERRERGLAPVSPTRGVAPEATGALQPAPDARHPPVPRSMAVLTRLLVVWVALIGAGAGLGLVLTEILSPEGVARFDLSILRQVLEIRSSSRTPAARAASALGSTPVMVALTALALVGLLAVTRRWLPTLFLAASMTGEVALFLVVSRIVDRARPPVDALVETLPPTPSFPSGHVGAAVCWYGAMAVLVATWWRPPGRWLMASVLALVSLAVGAGRLYLGVHFPTDVGASLLLAGAWLGAVTVFLLRPGRPGEDHHR